MYSYRYVILFLFCMYSLANAFGWVEYSIIHDIVKSHYNIENDETVNWTALLYSVSYIPLIFPATWLMERKGLRFVIILGALGTALGSWIKVNKARKEATARDRRFFFFFWLESSTVQSTTQSRI